MFVAATIVFLLTFTVVHELGHTILARVFGDSSSTFYLAKIEPGGAGMCLGCNITDHTKLTPAGNFLTSLGGLLFTQTVSIAGLILARWAQGGVQRLLLRVAVGFAFLDVVVQVVQGLLYRWGSQTWPTNVDLVDAGLLSMGLTGFSEPFLKAILFISSVLYLAGMLAIRRHLFRSGARQLDRLAGVP